MNLLFLNALKGLKHKKIQMVGIIFLIMLSTAIFTSLNVSIDRLENRYYDYLEEQNVEDFAFVPKIDYSKDFTKEEIENLKQNELKDISKDQMDFVNKYQMTLGIENIPNIDSLYKGIDYIFNTNGATYKKMEEKVENLTKKYDFSYGIEEGKVAKDNKNTFKVMEYDKDKKINIPYLVKGRFPENDNEITVLPDFAKLNNLNILDKYKIGDNEYKIVGYAFASDHIYPLISFSVPMFNNKTNSIIFMNQNSYNKFKGVKEISYVAAFNDKSKLLELEEIEKMLKDENITLSMTAAARIMRVKSLPMDIESDRLFAKYFLYLLLSISIFIILIVTKKRIEDERLQIGVLKALGYKSVSIAISYLVYPIVGSIIGSVTGYGIGILFHNFIADLWVSFYNLPILGYEFNANYLIYCILVPLILLSTLSFVIALVMLRKKPLELLKEGSNLKVNIFSKIITVITKKLSFKTRFRYSLASRSIGKLFIVSLTSFFTGLLIVLILVGYNLFTKMIDSTFKGLNFDNMISYNIPCEGNSYDEDLMYNTIFNLDSIEKKDGTIKTIKEIKDDFDRKYHKKIDEEKNKKAKISLNIKGIDNDNLKKFEILDENDFNISNLIKNDEDIIINKNVKENLGVNIGDKLKVKNKDGYIILNIVGIENSFMGQSIYIKRSYISNLLEDKLMYNTKYTSDPKYDNLTLIDKEENDNIVGVFGIKDLRRNMDEALQISSMSLYIIIGFAAIMALVIISVIANIVVEENKRTISLMKVLGYKNKDISSVVLNIYTPFIIIAYFISIPVMISLLKLITGSLMKDIPFALPIEFSFVKGLIGLILLLIAYYIAIIISRKTLNKVPLSVALKRE